MNNAPIWGREVDVCIVLKEPSRGGAKGRMIAEHHKTAMLLSCRSTSNSNSEGAGEERCGYVLSRFTIMIRSQREDQRGKIGAEV